MGRDMTMFLLIFLLSISPYKSCKTEPPKPEPGIEQCGSAGGFDFGTFLHSLTYRILDLTGSRAVTVGWVFFDALSSRESADYKLFQCIMKNVKSVLRTYHKDEINLRFDEVKSELRILKLYYPPPATIPHEKLDNVLSMLRRGAIHLKPVSEVRLSEHVFILTPIWAGLHIDIFRLRMKDTLLLSAVKQEMDIMILYYSKLLLRSWRSIRELRCSDKPKSKCYEEYGQSPAEVLVPGLKKNVNNNSNKLSLQSIIDGTKVKDASVISLRFTYAIYNHGLSDRCRNSWNSGYNQCEPVPAQDFKPWSGTTNHGCVHDGFHGKWLKCKPNCKCEPASCSETKLFSSDCHDENFQVFGRHQHEQVRSGDSIEIKWKNNRWYLGYYGLDGRTFSAKRHQSINQEPVSSTSNSLIYDGDIVYFGEQTKKVRFQIFLKGSEMTKDPAELPSPGLDERK